MGPATHRQIDLGAACAGWAQPCAVCHALGPHARAGAPVAGQIARDRVKEHAHQHGVHPQQLKAGVARVQRDGDQRAAVAGHRLHACDGSLWQRLPSGTLCSGACSRASCRQVVRTCVVDSWLTSKSRVAGPCSIRLAQESTEIMPRLAFCAARCVGGLPARQGGTAGCRKCLKGEVSSGQVHLKGPGICGAGKGHVVTARARIGDLVAAASGGQSANG